MPLSTAAEPVPFYILENGAARLNGSRVAFEGVILMFKQGNTAEEIHRDLPSAPLAEIHASIAYYLKHTEEVEAYLEECARVAEEMRTTYGGSRGCCGIRRRTEATLDREECWRSSLTRTSDTRSSRGW